MGLLKHRMAIVLLCAAVFLFAVFLVAGSGLAENRAESAGVQAEEMLDPALETYGWFCGEPMDCGETVTIEGVECRVVTDPRFQTEEQLSSHVRSIFSDSIADELLKNSPYFEESGVLWYRVPPALKQVSFSSQDVQISKSFTTVTYQSDDRFEYTVTVSYSPVDHPQETVKTEDYSFVCEKVDDEWVFTQFEYFL